MMDSTRFNPAFYQLVKLIASGASKVNARFGDIDWAVVIQFAQEQSVLPLLGCALLVNSDLDCPEQLKEQLLSIMRSQSGVNLVRKQRIMNLISDINKMGIETQLLKGYAIGSYYAYPEARGSTDTDLLISEANEKTVCSFLKEKGFRVAPRSCVSHHTVCQHPKLGMVEVHVHLYDEIVLDAWFQNVPIEHLIQEKSILISCPDASYSTLGYTDNLIFLTLHAIKHFINSGMSLRMLMDIALFWSANKECIDAERYWSLLEKLHYAKLVSNIMWILIDTECFHSDDFPGIGDKNEEAFSLILTDLEYGGHMGIKEKNRYFDLYEYNRQALLRTKTPAQYRMYMIKHKVRAAHHQMFPTKAQLVKLYPSVEDHAWLIPFVRLHRMFAYPVGKIRAGALREQIRNDDTTIPEEAKRRIEMFKSLGMI